MSKVDKNVVVSMVTAWIESADHEESKQLLLLIAGPIIATVIDNLIEAEVLEIKC